LLADTMYRTAYRQALQEVLDSAFNVTALSAQLQADHDLVSPYVAGPEAQDTWVTGFDTSLTNSRSTGLIDYVAVRRAAVENVLAGTAH
jgi:hypothetical protein